MQRASRIRWPHIVSETPPPPKMTVVFPARKRLTEKPAGPALLSPRRVPGCGRLAYGPDRVHDVLIASAPAEITLEPGTDALLRRLRFPPEQFQRAHDHSRGAKTALQGVMLAKRGLQRMLGITRLAQALNRVDRRSVRLNGQDRARLHGAAVEVHGARAALGRVAADMRARDAEVIPQEVHEQLPGLNLSLPPRAVDSNGDGMA
jgi:hypothetical protein